MVRSRFLTPEYLIAAMNRGDFYASSGVFLEDVTFDESTQTLSLQVQPKSGETYRTDFIATLASDPHHDDGHVEEDHAPRHDHEARIGVVVASIDGLQAKYKLTGNELYVRAVVTSSAPPNDPSFENQFKQAWTQPVGWRPAKPNATAP